MAISHLGYEIDSSQAKRAAVDLDAMTKSAERAEQGERDLARASQQAQTATGQLARASSGAATATGQLEQSLDGAAAAGQRMATSARTATGAMQALEVASMSAGMATMRNQQLMFQWVDIAQSLPLLLSGNIWGLQNLGFQMAQIGQMYYGQGGMGAALRESAVLLGGFAAAVWPAVAVVGALGFAILGMQQEINAAGGTVVSFGDVALATFQVISGHIMTALNPAISAIGSTFTFVWDHINNGVPPVVNLIINSFRAAAADVEYAVMALPDAFTVAGQAAANGFIQYISWMAREAISIINDVLTDINGLARAAGIGDVVGTLEMPKAPGPIDFGGSAASGRLAQLTAERNARIAEIMSSDPLGAFFDQVSAQATKNALNGVEEAATGAGGAIGRAANDNTDPWKGLRDVTKETGGAMKEIDSWAQSFGSTIANTLRQGGSLWDAFKKAGLDAVAKIGEAWITSGIQQMLGGFAGGGTGFFSNIFSWLGFARGAAFQAGNVIPFAAGGVVTSPTMFPMAGGRSGLMGEAGPEAIMPLRRGRDGRLGVAANGNSPAANNNVRIEQHFHISGAVSSDDVQQMVQQGSAESVRYVKDNLRGWQSDLQIYGRPA